MDGFPPTLVRNEVRYDDSLVCAPSLEQMSRVIRVQSLLQCQLDGQVRSPSQFQSDGRDDRAQIPFQQRMSKVALAQTLSGLQSIPVMGSALSQRFGILNQEMVPSPQFCDLSSQVGLLKSRVQQHR